MRRFFFFFFISIFFYDGHSILQRRCRRPSFFKHLPASCLINRHHTHKTRNSPLFLLYSNERERTKIITFLVYTNVTHADFPVPCPQLFDFILKCITKTKKPPPPKKNNKFKRKGRGRLVGGSQSYLKEKNSERTREPKNI